MSCTELIDKSTSLSGTSCRNYAFLVLKWITVRGMVFWWSGSIVLGWKVAVCCVLAVSQIVVPKPLRVERLQLAHDGWPYWIWCLITLKTKLSSIFCFCHFRLKSLMDLFTLSWAVSLRLKEGWNMGWCQRKRNLCSFSGKSTRSVSCDKLSLFMEKSTPWEEVKSHGLPVSVKFIRVDTLIFFILKELMAALQAQAANLQNIQCLGGEILASCHPDSIITIKSWISVTKTRYEEVSVTV